MTGAAARDPRIDAIVRAVLDACAPRLATRRALEGHGLRGPVSILAVGKCALEMMRGALDVLTPGEAMAISPPGAHDDLVARGVIVRVGGHPDPVPHAADHGREALALARRAHPEGTLLVLLSGGGSALLELPADGISVGGIAAMARALMASGAPIEELNLVRAGLSALKGGRLAAASRARVSTFLVEDVPARPELVASGPTARPPLGDAREVLARHGVRADQAVSRALGRAPAFLVHEPELVTVLDNAIARRAVMAEGARLGMPLRDLGATLRGEAREVGAHLADRLWRGDAFVIGGETTVTVTGTGRGGRNQELVLGGYLAHASGLLSALGTDGIDGASEHAGAYLDEAAWSSIREVGRRAALALAENASAAFFEETGTAIVTGPTGTNVADVVWAIPRTMWMRA